MTTPIVAEGVRKRYGDVEAVADVTLEVSRGECVALLGPNGAGKTTFTEILEGYRHRDAGEVRVLDLDPAEATSAWRSRIGIVLQTARDLPDLTVEESVRHFSGYFASPEPLEVVLDQVGLREKRASRVDKLSGGQRRRLDVALGIVGRPELLFLDEPTTGFDPEARRQFWDLVDALSARGTTILLTTHYLEEAERLADKVAVIADGRVAAFDRPDRIGGRQLGLARVRWLVDGSVREEETDEPTRVVQQLAARFGGEVPGLEVHKPTLEDIYLELIGHRGAEPDD
jgi:ABC-2 type transport system ATP-binding protein